MRAAFGKILVICFMINLAGCASNTQGENTGVGAVVGGIGGAVVSGGKVVGAGIGAVVGALLGGTMGHSMSSADQSRVYHAVATGRKTTWVDSKNHTTYTVIPSKNYMTINGNHYCRKFAAISNHNGEVNKMHGSACLQNGKWQIVK